MAKLKSGAGEDRDMTWYLETERLKLRAIDSTDARNLYELNGDPRVMEFLSPEYDTLEEAEAILPKVVARNKRYGNQLGLFAAIEKGAKSSSARSSCGRIATRQTTRKISRSATD